MQHPNQPTWRRTLTPIALAVVSLFAAIALWVAVTDAQNPNRVDVFSGGIEVKAVNVPAGQAVASFSNPTVTLRISASEDTFGKLTASDFEAIVDMTGEHNPSADKAVIARVVGKKDVQIVEVSPAVVTVSLEQEAAKQIPVLPNLIGAPPQGYSVSGSEPSPGVVRITGAASLVQLVANAVADINLTGLRVTTTQQYVLTPRDARGADIRGLRLDPANSDIKVNISQQQVTLALTIAPQVQGSVADGYNLLAVTSDPPALAVSGPLELLQALSSITTEPIDLSGLRADQTRTVRLRLPSGLQVPRDSVTVRLKVSPAQGDILTSVAPQVTDVAEGLKASVQTQTINVKLHGDLPTLRTLPGGAIKATVSAAGLEEGVHVLDTTVSGPDGVQITSSDPQQVVVVLRK